MRNYFINRECWGEPKEFDKEQIEKLYEIRRKMGISGKHPADFS